MNFKPTIWYFNHILDYNKIFKQKVLKLKILPILHIIGSNKSEKNIRFSKLI